MTPVPPKNLAHSVRNRLLKLTRARGEDFNFVLVRYALERLLYRVMPVRDSVTASDNVKSTGPPEPAGISANVRHGKRSSVSHNRCHSGSTQL